MQSTMALALTLAAAIGTGAQALTVADGGTGSAGAGGFTFPDDTPTTDWDGSRPGVWTNAATDPASFWVRPLTPSTTSNVFKFTFDLAGFGLSTGAMTVSWTVDNAGTIDLNGSELRALSSGSSAYDSLDTFSVDNTGPLVGGINTVLFNQTGDGTSDGLRASMRVTADAAVPLSAGASLLIGGLAALALLRRQNTS